MGRGRESALAHQDDGRRALSQVSPPRAAPAGTWSDTDVRTYLDEVLAEIHATLLPRIERRLRGAGSRVPPSELVRRMLAVSPPPVEVNPMTQQIGPSYYDTSGVAVVLSRGGASPVSKQAIEQRRNRRSILALQTSDGRWIYPTWQFRDHDLVPGLVDVLREFAERAPAATGWSVGTWLTTPSIELDASTAAEWLASGRDRGRVIALAARAASTWAA